MPKLHVIVEYSSVSCGAAPILGNGAPETSAVPPNALLRLRRRPLGMQGRLSQLVARIERDQIISLD
jgi:hypothetical protein